ncbi:MAG: choice-of-anchor U domain-containing protein [Candidatus Nitrosocaldus sp.]
MAQDELLSTLFDTASFTDSILSALGIASLLSDTASFTDSILSALIASSIASLLSDTASFTDSILSALGIAAPTTADAISFTDSLAHQLGLANQAVTSPTTGGIINLNITNGGFIHSSIQTPSTTPLLPPNAISISFPHGIVSWQAITTPNSVVTITINYPSLPSLASNQSYAFYKFNSGTWIPVTQSTTPLPNTFSISGTTVTLMIQDNGSFDFDPTPGVISDPGGIAVVTTAQPPAAGGGGGGGGGGGAIVISQQRSTVQTQLALQQALPSSIEIGKDVTIAGSLTDDKGSKLALNGTMTIVVEADNKARTYIAELKQGDYSITLKASELLKALKSRSINITVKFDGFEVQETRQRVVEYKSAEIKHTLKITGEEILKSVKQFKRAGASLLLLDNFTDKSIAKIMLKAEGSDAKIILAKGKDMDRMRISMQEVMLEVKDGKLIGFGDTARILVYARGTVTYTVYDMQGNVIAEGRV